MATLLGCLAGWVIGDFSSKRPEEREVKVSSGIATIVPNVGRKGYAKGSKTIVVNRVKFICKATGPVSAETCVSEEALSKIAGKHVRAFWYSRRGTLFVNSGKQLLRIEDESGSKFIVSESFTNREPDWGAVVLMILFGIAAGVALSRNTSAVEANSQ